MFIIMNFIFHKPQHADNLKRYSTPPMLLEKVIICKSYQMILSHILLLDKKFCKDYNKIHVHYNEQ